MGKKKQISRVSCFVLLLLLAWLIIGWVKIAAYHTNTTTGLDIDEMKVIKNEQQIHSFLFTPSLPIFPSLHKMFTTLLFLLEGKLNEP